MIEMRRSDATEGLRDLSAASADLIITDPAYESLEKWRAQGTTTRLKKSDASSNEWFPVVPNSYFPEFFRECYRVLKPGTHCYVFCDPDTMFEIRPVMQAAGFEMKKPLIWRKMNENPTQVACEKCGRPVVCTACGHEVARFKPAMGMGYPYRSTYEVVLLGLKGRRPAPDDKTVLDVLDASRIKNLPGWNGDRYPTEKPLSLIEVFLRQSSAPGELVVDPFAGSGATLEAARRQGRRALGFDIQQATVDRFNGAAPGALPALPPAEPQQVCDLFGLLAEPDPVAGL